MRLVLEPLRPDLAGSLGKFFASLTGDAAHFHPHELTKEKAVQLSSMPTRDVYVVARIEFEVLAYGLLRGWDEGFEVPRLGVAVSPNYRGKGIGRVMMEYLHAIAKLRGASKVQLKVHQQNTRARLLYTALGYEWVDELVDGQLLGQVDFVERS